MPPWRRSGQRLTRGSLTSKGKTVGFVFGFQIGFYRTMRLMMNAESPEALYRQLLAADEAGVRLEMAMGQPTWEFHPSPLHQSVLRDIVRSIQSFQSKGEGCGCFDLTDVYIAFPDRSVKRPDVALFCVRPPITQDAITVVPDAVVEIVSPGSEHKDLVTGPPFYLSQGVQDVVVCDPRTLMVLHHRRSGVVRYVSPVTLTLDCGCMLTA